MQTHEPAVGWPGFRGASAEKLDDKEKGAKVGENDDDKQDIAENATDPTSLAIFREIIKMHGIAPRARARNG
ncbi:MAG: hypothetical protein SH809_08465 [Rhodothermales bacterium]|nr:hypothetical protein [Rhodothermales bacterium]